MNTNVLLVIGAIALVIFLFQFFVQIARIRRGVNYVSGGRAAMNWILLILAVLSFGTYAYSSHVLHTDRLADLVQGHKETSQATKSSAKPKAKKSKHHQAIKPFIKWDDKDTRLNKDNVATVAFEVSPDTHVEIIGQRTGQVYKSFTTKKTKGQHTVYFDFKNAGKYELKITRHGKHLTKELEIKPQEGASSSSSASQSSQQPANNNNQTPPQQQPATATTNANNRVRRVRRPKQAPAYNYRRPANSSQHSSSTPAVESGSVSQR